MKPALSRRWLRDLEAIAIVDEASVSEAREHVRTLGASIGMPEVATACLVTVVSELAHNHLAHASRGAVAARSIDRLGVPGIEVVAADEGKGIRDPARALRGGASTKTGLGVGLGSVFELAGEVDIDVRFDEGSCVWARKFAAPVPRRRQVAIFGRPITGERVSGDDAAFARLADGRLVVALADGLGHGPEARAASSAAIEEVFAAPDRSLDRALSSVHAALRGTRGAVVALSTIGVDDAVEVAVVGNITAQIAGRSTSRRFGGHAWVLGQSARAGTITVERSAIAEREMLVLSSDGLSGKVGLEALDGLLLEPPIVAAQSLMERYAQAHDDALILVVR